MLTSISRSWLRRICGFTFTCALTLPAHGAHAQPIQRSEQRLIDSLITQLEQVGRGPMELRLGFGPVLTVPDSGKAKFHAFVPLLSFRYHDWFVIEETQMRADIVDFDRKRLNDSDTQKLGQAGTSLEVGAHAVYFYGPARVRSPPGPAGNICSRSSG
ncbi:MAG: hypothetical protein ACYCZX_03620 [Rhodospirillaceae bacterium]